MRRLALALLLVALPLAARAQQAHAIKVTRQPSIIYMPTYVMEAAAPGGGNTLPPWASRT